jgi:hypothetical protein
MTFLNDYCTLFLEKIKDSFVNDKNYYNIQYTVYYYIIQYTVYYYVDVHIQCVA